MNPWKSPNAEIFFGHAHEDVAVEQRVFASTLSGGAVVAIASGGDAALALRLAGADEVIVADTNAGQIHLLELLRAGIELDGRNGTRWLNEDARPLLERAGPRLSVEARRFWDQRRKSLKYGLHRCGRADRVLWNLSRFLRLVFWSRDLLAPDLPRAESWRSFFATHRWQIGWQALRMFAPAVFPRVLLREFPAGWTERLRQRFEGVARRSETPNPWLQLHLAGSWRASPPEWWSGEAFSRVQEEGAGWDLRTGSVGEVLDAQPAGSIRFVHLSNILDFVPAGERDHLAGTLARALKPGGCAVVRSLFLRAEDLPVRPDLAVDPGEAIAATLAADRSALCPAVAVWRKSEDGSPGVTSRANIGAAVERSFQKRLEPLQDGDVP